VVVELREFPGVVRLRLPMPGPLDHVYSYVILRGDRGVVVDAGFNRDDRDYLNYLLKLMDEVRLDYVVITHMHSDHFGGVDRLRELGIRSVAHGADVSLSRLSRDEFLRMNGEILAGAGVPREELDLFMFMMRYSDYEPPDVDVVVNDDAEINGVRLLWTPGHTPGHLSVVSGEYFFSGDFILPRITPHVGLHPGDDDPLRDYLRSLRRVMELQVKLVLPAHQFEFTDLRARAMELLEHHTRRLCEIASHLASPRSAFQVATSLSWTRRKLGYWELNPMNRMMAITETLAHLRHLEQGGYVKAQEVDGVIQYRLVQGFNCHQGS
jgi:glyoxylase-like metal-dependent hydrolase (beta-lactamase superfamily II)